MIAGWLVKFIIWFAVIGLVLFEAGSIVVNVISLDTAADEVAVIIARDIGAADLRNIEEVEARADTLAQEKKARVAEVTVSTDGVVFLRLKREAPTLIVKRVSFMEKWGKGTAEASSPSGRNRPFER